MRTTLWKSSPELLFTLLAAVVFFGDGNAAYAQTQTRSFQMALWADPTSGHPDSDIAVLYAGATPAGQPPPPTKFIIVSAPFGTSYYDPSQAYDWSRVVAVEIDEPYSSIDHVLYNGNGTPACQVAPDIANTDAMLRLRAMELQALAPKARFWVNFDRPEALWMGACQTPQVFNRDYIDVISADWTDDWANNDMSSLQPFYNAVVAANPPANPSQQLALIPGVYSAPSDQTSHLQGFLGYANSMNQTGCNLPLGSRGVTGIFDRCPVWIVLGWWSGGAYAGSSPGYVGMLQPGSESIKQAWENELALPLAPNLAHQRSPAQIIVPTLQLLLQ